MIITVQYQINLARERLKTKSKTKATFTMNFRVYKSDFSLI